MTIPKAGSRWRVTKGSGVGAIVYVRRVVRGVDHSPFAECIADGVLEIKLPLDERWKNMEVVNGQ